jgi:hypothetical protein
MGHSAIELLQHERGIRPGSGTSDVKVTEVHFSAMVIFLLKPIRQSVSACRGSREDVHLWPKSRWFEGKLDEKV